MNRRIVRRITIWLVVVVVILGCGTPALVTPPPLHLTRALSKPSLCRRPVAAQTQTALVLPPSATPSLTPPPTKTFTVTPTPTATVLFLIATKTSVPIATSLFTGGDGNGTGSGNDGSSGGGGFVKPTATPQEWNCRVLSKSPANRRYHPRRLQFQSNLDGPKYRHKDLAQERRGCCLSIRGAPQRWKTLLRYTDWGWPGKHAQRSR